MDTLQGNSEKWMIYNADMNGLCFKQLKIYKSKGRGAISNWSEFFKLFKAIHNIDILSIYNIDNKW